MNNLRLPEFKYTRGLHDLGHGAYAWLQPDGSWGWSNAGLITDGKESFLVDTLFDLKLTGDMLTAMQAATPAALHIKSMVNTHSNGDHCNGNILIEGAEIIASKNTAAAMAYENPAMMVHFLKEAPNMGELGQWFKKSFGHFQFEGIERKLPNLLFEGKLERKVGNKTIELIEVGPAHTAGDTIVHVPELAIIFTGDILFIEGHPLMWAGPVSNWLKACDLIVNLKPKIVIPGHGPITDIRGVLAIKEYFQFVASEARKHFDAGKEILEAAQEMLKNKYRQWGDSERMAANVAMMYREFKGETAPLNMIELLSLMARCPKVETGSAFTLS